MTAVPLIRLVRHLKDHVGAPRGVNLRPAGTEVFRLDVTEIEKLEIKISEIF